MPMVSHSSQSTFISIILFGGRVGSIGGSGANSGLESGELDSNSHLRLWGLPELHFPYL